MDNAAKSIVELGDSLKKLEELKETIREKKQEESRLRRNVDILKKAELDERGQYEMKKKERAGILKEIEEKIKNMTAQRGVLSSSVVPEMKKLNELKTELDKQENEIKNEREKMTADINRMNKDQAEIERKKSVLTRIFSLIKEL